MQPPHQIRLEYTVEPLSADTSDPVTDAARHAVEGSGLTPEHGGPGTVLQGPSGLVSRTAAEVVRSAMDAGADAVSLLVSRG